jgi:acetyl esterase/lipase
MVYLHGGAFVGCGLRTHRRLVARLSAACDAQVLNVDYRMLPRNTINDSLSDALAAYQQVLRDGTPAERTVFAGDSAGGGLVLLTALAAREAGLPQPAALVAISPWANMDVEALVSHRNTDVDAVIPPRALRVLVERLVRRGLDLDPRLSAIGADLSGLPRTLIHVGTEEVLELDAQTLAEELAHAGVPTHLKLWTGLFHVFPVAADLIPEARDSIADIGAFVRSATRLQPRSRRT